MISLFAIQTQRDSYPTRHHRILQGLEYLCWSAGILAVVYVTFALWSSARFQATETKRFEALQQQSGQEVRPQPGNPFGKISIARIGLSAIVAEGVDDRTLRHAVGHFPESSSPEKAGTVALAGHRDSFFRGLDRIRANDLVTLETPHGKYEYEVVRIAVVGPEHVEFVRFSSQSDLTLVTCFPFGYIGRAPQRFIVQAVRIRAQSGTS
jgi:LPXTG-site transpeptidase (sortase) family protein